MPAKAAKLAKETEREGGYWDLVDELNPGMVRFEPNQAYAKAAKREAERGRKSV